MSDAGDAIISRNNVARSGAELPRLGSHSPESLSCGAGAGKLRTKDCPAAGGR